MPQTSILVPGTAFSEPREVPISHESGSELFRHYMATVSEETFDWAVRCIEGVANVIRPGARTGHYVVTLLDRHKRFRNIQAFERDTAKKWHRIVKEKPNDQNSPEKLVRVADSASTTRLDMIIDMVGDQTVTEARAERAKQVLVMEKIERWKLRNQLLDTTFLFLFPIALIIVLACIFFVS